MLIRGRYHGEFVATRFGVFGLRWEHTPDGPVVLIEWEGLPMERHPSESMARARLEAAIARVERHMKEVA